MAALKRRERKRKAEGAGAKPAGAPRARDKKNKKRNRPDRKTSSGKTKSGKEKKKREQKKTSAAAASDVETSRGWAALTDLLGRRAAMRVLWELRGEPLRFRALQDACDGLSPSTLNQRIGDLREARLLVLDERAGYTLTLLGLEVVERLAPLAVWAEPWSHRRAQKRAGTSTRRRMT